MEKRSRLGRGLSSLLNATTSEATVSIPEADIKVQEVSIATHDHIDGQMFHVELSRVVPCTGQPRKTFDEESLRDLASSISTAGILHPILVRPIGDKFEVIAGERRWRAAEIAGLKTVPIIVRIVSPSEQSRLALIENIHRKDLNPVERAEAYLALITQTGYTHLQLAEQLGEERSSVSNQLRLLDLNTVMRQLLIDKKLSLGHAKLLAGITDEAEQIRLAERVVRQQLSVRALEKILKNPDTLPRTISKHRSAHIGDLERQLSRDLQMRAQVHQAAKGGKGKLVIHYASLDQFDELLIRLGVKVDA